MQIKFYLRFITSFFLFWQKHGTEFLALFYPTFHNHAKLRKLSIKKAGPPLLPGSPAIFYSRSVAFRLPITRATIV
jgi:hypothetical protein